MFFAKKEEKDLSSTIKDLCERVANVESKLKGLEIENTDLRNKVLRKIQDRNPTKDSEIPQNINTFNPFKL